MKSIPVNIDRWSDNLPAMELALRWARWFDAAPLGVGFIDERGGRARSADEGAVPSRADTLAASLSSQGRGRPVRSSVEVSLLGGGADRPLLPTGEKVPEGRIRGSGPHRGEGARKGDEGADGRRLRPRPSAPDRPGR
jgi:hypothetical protein